MGLMYIGYVVANFLSMMGGKGWTIEERFYPGVCVIPCGLIAIASLHKSQKKEAKEAASALKGSEVVT